MLSGADRQDTRRGRAIVGADPADGDPRRAHRAAGRPGRRRAAGRGHRRPGGRGRGRRRVRRRAGARAAAGRTRTPERLAEPDPALRTLSLARYGMAEEAVAEGVARLAATAERIADPASVRSVAKGLDKAQQAAVAQVLGAGVSLLTGGPGTGKSRTVAARRQAAAGQGHRGRAGRPDRPGGQAAGGAHRPPRGRPCTGCSGAQGTTGGFARNEEWPLDADVIVVDEASMLDVELTAALLEALPRRHAPAAGRRPGAAALDRPGPRARRPDRLRRRAGDRADHAVPAGRGRRDRPAGDRRCAAASCRRSTPPTARWWSCRPPAAPRRRGGWCSWSPTRSPGRWASTRDRCRW